MAREKDFGDLESSFFPFSNNDLEFFPNPDPNEGLLPSVGGEKMLFFIVLDFPNISGLGFGYPNNEGFSAGLVLLIASLTGFRLSLTSLACLKFPETARSVYSLILLSLLVWYK